MLQARILSVALAAAAVAGSASGAEFRVNSYTTGVQSSPAVAAGADGGFVVVWHSTDYYVSSIVGRRVDSAGGLLGAEFQIDSGATFLDTMPSVAPRADGGFVVAWHRLYVALNQQQVYGRRIDSAGSPLGDEFKVSTSTTSSNGYPAVATVGTGGEFVVVWQSSDQFSASGLFGQRFDATGGRLGSEFRVDTYTSAGAFASVPAVTADPSGGFVVAWEGFTDGSPDASLLTRRFDSSGNPVGAEVHSGSSDDQRRPSIAATSTGGFVLAWVSRQINGFENAFTRPFDSFGTPLGSEFLLSSFTRGTQIEPSVATDADGNFVVLWQNDNPGDGFQSGIFARRFDSAGTPGEAEFRLNTYTLNNQRAPSVAVNSEGTFLAAWHSTLQDGSGLGVYATTGSVRALNVADVAVGEGDSSTTNADFQVSLTAASDQVVTVHFATLTGTAGTQDLTAKAGVLSFSPGVTAQTIHVPVKGDTLNEDDETFTVLLSSPVGAGIGRGVGTGTILDDDPLPSVSVNDVAVVEGGIGQSATASFTISLSRASGRQVVVDYATSDVSASAPADYAAKAGTLVFLPGAVKKTVAISVKGDVVDEGVETFEVGIPGVTNATIADSVGVGTILDDDAVLPSATVSDAPAVSEGGSAVFTITLSPAASQTVSVKYATASGTATQGKDYVAKQGTLTFHAGESVKTVGVTSKTDALAEAAESFVLNLHTPLGVAIVDGQGVGTISGP